MSILQVESKLKADLSMDLRCWKGLTIQVRTFAVTVSGCYVDILNDAIQHESKINTHFVQQEPKGSKE